MGRCCVILGVVLVNVIVSFMQESRAEAALESLAAMMKTEATVRRDGRHGSLGNMDLFALSGVSAVIIGVVGMIVPKRESRKLR